MSSLIEQYLGIGPDLQSKLLITFIIVITVYFFQRIVVKYFLKAIDGLAIRYQWQKIILYISVLIAVIFLIRVWFGAFESIGTYFGLLSAGLAIALKDLLINFVGWFFILIRKPFRVGDRIQIGDTAGDVIDLRIFQFSIIEIGNWVDADQSTGRIIHIPNGLVFSKVQANYTAGFEFIWNEIPVLVTFESDWKNAKKILLDAASKHSIHFNAEAERQIKAAAQKFLIFYKNLTPIVYTSVKDSGVMLTIRYLCNARQRRSSEQAILEEVLEQFSQYKNIDFAYPTQRFYNNPTEGKGTKDEAKN
jgi:small-conductance mechanosensitive channel